MKWAGHVARIVEEREYKDLVGKPERIDKCGDLEVDGWLLGRNSWKWDVRSYVDWIGLDQDRDR